MQEILVSGTDRRRPESWLNMPALSPGRHTRNIEEGRRLSGVLWIYFLKGNRVDPN
jgi:hypothetical protein